MFLVNWDMEGLKQFKKQKKTLLLSYDQQQITYSMNIEKKKKELINDEFIYC